MSEQDRKFERNVAICEANHIHDSDAYFKARPQIDSADRRKVFEAGYIRAWNASTAEANKRIAELQANNNNLREALIVCKQYITEAIIDDKYHEASCGLDELYLLRDKAINLHKQALANTPNVSEWVGLSDEQKGYIRYHHPTDLVNATEAKLRELNTKG